MLPCNQCHGSGIDTCAECAGIGYVQEVRGSGETEYHACGECHGKKRARCDACGGIGWLGADNAVSFSDDYSSVEDDLPEGLRDGGRFESASIARLVSGDW
jgi:DnaJ-class molecular chaperone